MMNWKGCGRKETIVVYFKAPSRHLPGETEKNDKKTSITIIGVPIEI
jgi:hypothetical protein